jgi:DNA modification methylase
MSTPYYSDEHVTVYHGDCPDVIRELPDCSVDSVCTDPPYDLTANKRGGTGMASVNLNSPAGRARITAGFMGQAWDGTGIAFKPDVWVECLRVLKPGGHLLAFGGSRTWHRMAVAVENAGFEMRDSIAWLYGSGFPKSLDVGKAIDKAAGAERTERSGVKPGHENFIGRDNIASLREGGALSGEGGYSRPWMHDPEKVEASHYTYAPVTHDAEHWHGWGTALKPAFEPIIVARKPFVGTVAANVLTHGTGALNIDGCRVAPTGESRNRAGEDSQERRYTETGSTNFAATPGIRGGAPNGRWPTNVVLSDDQAAELDRQSGLSTSPPVGSVANKKALIGQSSFGDEAARVSPNGHGDSGGASRFFPTFRYEAKAPATERPRVDGIAHPTVKPLGFMRWLVRLVTPPGGTVLEPFAGSGTTAEACVHEHMRCIAIEREAAYLPLIVARLSKPMQVGFDFGGVA